MSHITKNQYGALKTRAHQLQKKLDEVTSERDLAREAADEALMVIGDHQKALDFLVGWLDDNLLMQAALSDSCPPRLRRALKIHLQEHDQRTSKLWVPS